MSYKVKPHHPLKELLAKLLFGIETVSTEQQKKIKVHACTMAAKWHDSEVESLTKWINGLECNLIYSLGYCPDCYRSLFWSYKNHGHSYDCKLKCYINSIRE